MQCALYCLHSTVRQQLHKLLVLRRPLNNLSYRTTTVPYSSTVGVGHGNGDLTTVNCIAYVKHWMRSKAAAERGETDLRSLAIQTQGR